MIDSDLLAPGEVGLSRGAAQALAANEESLLKISHAPTLDSDSALRAKIYGHRLGALEYKSIMADVSRGHYSDIHLAAFLSACAGGRMDLQETIDLTRAMVEVGETIDWGRTPIADKHCVGGLPGNRTTPIVVAIIAAAGGRAVAEPGRRHTDPGRTAAGSGQRCPAGCLRTIEENRRGCDARRTGHPRRADGQGAQ